MNMNFLKDRYKEWSDSYEFDHPGTRCGNELLERADKASSSVTAELFGKIEKKEALQAAAGGKVWFCFPDVYGSRLLCRL